MADQLITTLKSVPAPPEIVWPVDPLPGGAGGANPYGPPAMPPPAGTRYGSTAGGGGPNPPSRPATMGGGGGVGGTHREVLCHMEYDGGIPIGQRCITVTVLD